MKDYAALEARLAEVERLIKLSPEIENIDLRQKFEARAREAEARKPKPKPVPPKPRVKVFVAPRFGRDLATPPIYEYSALRKGLTGGGNILPFSSKTHIDPVTRVAEQGLAHVFVASHWRDMLAADPVLTRHVEAGDLLVSELPSDLSALYEPNPMADRVNAAAATSAEMSQPFTAGTAGRW